METQQFFKVDRWLRPDRGLNDRSGSEMHPQISQIQIPNSIRNTASGIAATPGLSTDGAGMLRMMLL
jgi:hypothetical protein